MKKYIIKNFKSAKLKLAKLKIFYRLILLISIISIYSSSLGQRSEEAEKYRSSLTNCTRSLFFAPTESAEKGPRKLYPENSINKSTVENFYGKAGLNLDNQIVSLVKSFYFFLEFCAKMEKAAKALTVFEKTLTQRENSWEKIYKITTEKDFSWIKILQKIKKQDLEKIKPSQKAWNYLAVNKLNRNSILLENLNNKAPENFWEKLAKSSFWKEITITEEELKNSYGWQSFLKYSIITSIEGDKNLLERKNHGAQDLFYYITHIETAYYSDDFSKKRHALEFVNTLLFLSERNRNKNLENCPEWKDAFNKNKNSKNNKNLGGFKKKIKEFESSSLYTALETMHKSLQPADQGLSPKNTRKTENKLKKQILDLPVQDKYAISLINMASNLQGLISSLLVDFQNLEKTREILEQKAGPEPSIFNIQKEDIIYWQDIQFISEKYLKHEKAQKKAEQLALKCKELDWDNELVIAQSAFVDFFKRVGKSFGEKFVGTFKHFVLMIADEAKTFYYQSGLAQVHQHMSKEDARKMASNYSHLAQEEAKGFRDDVGGLIANTISLVGMGVVGTIVALPLSQIFQDENLISDFGGFVETLADALGKSIELVSGLAFAGEIVHLAKEAISILTNTILRIGAQGGILGGTEGWGEQWFILAESVVSTLLEALTFTANTLKAVFSDIIHSVGYLIKELTDAVIDSTAGLGALFKSAIDPSQKISNYFEKAKIDIGKHRRAISMAVTSIVILTASVLTAGSVGSALATTVAHLAIDTPFIVSAAQQDVKAKEQEKEFEEFIEKINKWTLTQTVSARAAQSAARHQLDSQLNAEIINRQIGLGLYQRYLDKYINSITCQSTLILGQNQRFLLENGVISGDIGKPFGQVTGWLNLNPNRGLTLYEPSRKAIVQEIADFPAKIKDKKQENSVSANLWYLQSITKDFKKSEFNGIFDIKFRPLYLLDEFYIGIGIGGIPLDTEWIKQNQIGYLDRLEFAKIFSCYKLKKSPNIYFGVLQPNNDTAESWTVKRGIPAPKKILPGKFYRMQAKLDGNSLLVKAWQEGDKEQENKNFTRVSINPVSNNYLFDKCKCKFVENNKANQDNPCTKDGFITDEEKIPLSIIHSGASVEFEVIEPKEKMDDSIYRQEIGKKAPMDLEKIENLEVQNKKSLKLHEKLLNPNNFGEISLTPISEVDIIKGIYTYSTNTETFEGSGVSDCVVFAEKQEQNKNKKSSYILGIPPLEDYMLKNKKAYRENVFLISLLTGKIINKNNTPVSYKTNALFKYKNPFSFTKSLESGNNPVEESVELNRILELHTQKNNFTQSLGGINFSIADPEEFKNGRFVYQTKDIFKKLEKLEKENLSEIIDYIIFIKIEGDMASNLGLIFNPKNTEINGIFSLVSEKVFKLVEKNSAKPVNKNLNIEETKIKINTLEYNQTNGDFGLEFVEKVRKEREKYKLPEKEEFSPVRPVIEPKEEIVIKKKKKKHFIPKLAKPASSLNKNTQSAAEELVVE